MEGGNIILIINTNSIIKLCLHALAFFNAQRIFLFFKLGVASFIICKQTETRKIV